MENECMVCVRGGRKRSSVDKVGVFILRYAEDRGG